MKIIVTEEKQVRLDKYIISIGLSEVYSRSYVNKLIDEDCVTVNGKIEKKSYKLNQGDEIDIFSLKRKMILV